MGAILQNKKQARRGGIRVRNTMQTYPVSKTKRDQRFPFVTEKPPPTQTTHPIQPPKKHILVKGGKAKSVRENKGVRMYNVLFGEDNHEAAVTESVHRQRDTPLPRQGRCLVKSRSPK